MEENLMIDQVERTNLRDDLKEKDSRIQMLEREVRTLQEQLQQSYIRIKELTTKE